MCMCIYTYTHIYIYIYNYIYIYIHTHRVAEVARLGAILLAPGQLQEGAEQEDALNIGIIISYYIT